MYIELGSRSISLDYEKHTEVHLERTAVGDRLRRALPRPNTNKAETRFTRTTLLRG